MKLHSLNFAVAVCASALLAYAIWSLDANGIKLTSGVGSFLFLAGTLGTAIGMRFEDARVGVSVRLVASIFFVLALCANLIIVFAGWSPAGYVITCGILFLLFVLLANRVFAAEQD